MAETRLVGITEIMPLYGYPVPDDPEEMRKVKARFASFKCRNPRLFPRQVVTGKWLMSDVLKHLESKPWERSSKPQRRNRPARALGVI